MNGKVAIVVSIFAAMLRLLPGMSITSPIQSNVHQYQVGNEKVIFNGKQVFISFGNSSEKVSWIIEKMTPSGLRTEHLAHFRVKRIVNANQNSAVLIENNSQVRAAEIYSFSHDSIDASIAVKNLNPRNATYVVTFVVVTNHRDHVSTFGFSGGSISLPITQKTVFVPINSRSWIYSDQNILISWKNEMAIFHSGILMSDTRNNVVSLPFGPFTLSNNETTSIDPVIRPDRIIGGGGGGGGSSGSPPTASLGLPGVSSTNDAFVYGTAITLAADVSSMGTPDPVSTTYVTMDFYGLTSSGGQTFLFQKTVTSTGTFDYTWNPAPGYYTGVKMTYGGYWGQGTPSQVNQPIKIYDALANSGSTSGPTDAASTTAIYNGQGTLQGYMVIQVEGPSQPVPNLNTPRILLQSAFVTVNDTSVAYIQNFTDIFTMTGNSANTFQSGYFSQATQGIYDGSSQSSSYTYIEDALYAALTVLAGYYSLPVSAALSAIGVLAFTSYSSTQYNGANQLVVSVSNPLDYPFYTSSGAPDWIYYVVDQIGWQSYVSSSITSNNAVLNYFEYSAYFGLHEPNYLTTITGSISEPIYIAQIYS